MSAVLHSIWSSFVTNPASYIASILGVVGFLVGGASWLSSKRKQQVATAAHWAFLATEDFASQDTSNAALDKAAKGLQVVDSWMVANGWRPLKPGEQQVVKVAFQALNAQADAAKALVAAGAIPTVPAVPK